MTSSPVLRFLTAAFRPSTWREFAYLWGMFGVACFGWVVFVAVFAAGAPLAITVIGLFGTAFIVSGSRAVGAASRGLSRALAGVDVPAPAPYPRGTGFFGWAFARLSDAATWRAFAFLPIAFITTMFATIVSTVFLVTSLSLVTAALWAPFIPNERDGQPAPNGIQFVDGWVDTPGEYALIGVVGLVVFLFVWPAMNHGFARLHTLLVRALLGRSNRERLREVTTSRTVSVATADARLRQIERDLHDGTQARLVGLAMTLGDARDRLASGQDAASVATLVDNAHAATKQALVELRDLAAGIHPPALDAGLETALETVAATSALPVTFHSSLRERPSSVVESIVYFSVLELLTNAAKHAEASSASITLSQRGDRLEVVVADDGRGGAYIGFGEDASATGRGSGLRGLRERVGTVDGTLLIDSPDGGPTRITLDLPLAAL